MNLFFLNLPITAAVVLLPALGLVIKGSANDCLYLLVLVGLIAVALRVKSMDLSFGTFLKKYWWLHLAMVLTTIATLIHQVGAGSYVLKAADISSRLAYFPLIAWALALLPYRQIKLIQWGFPVGAMVAAVRALEAFGWEFQRVTHVGFLNPIPFGDMALLLGIFSLLSIGWRNRKPRHRWLSIALIIFQVAGGFAGLFAAYVCQVRGGWIAVPVLMLVALGRLRGVKSVHKWVVLGAVLASMVALYFGSHMVEGRVDDVATEISLYAEGKNVDTSIGVRFQHWKGSWLLFKEHPVIGIGREHLYPEALQKLHARGVISEAATHFVHSHNELLFSMATLGIFGILAYLSLHFAPMVFFYRAARSPDQEIRTTGSMGLVLCLGFFVFGLTEVIFFTSVANGFFSVIAAALFVCVIKREHMLANSTSSQPHLAGERFCPELQDRA